MRGPAIVRFLSVVSLLLATSTAVAGQVQGTLRQWHSVEVVFNGPTHSESASNPNPFLDYRLNCTFTGPSNQVYVIPGFFDANGSGGSSGLVWKCRFAPDEVGSWSYSASFRQGTNVAVSLGANAGSPTSFNGDSGIFSVAASNKSGGDFRGPDRGRLVNVGDHYLTFLGSGDRWIKGGPNIPENFLGYEGFDNTPPKSNTHDFSPHLQDWNPGDPDWDNGAGKGIIGALNYISEQGGNSIYFLPMNIGGDANDTFPTIAEQDKTHYDTSKLQQWEIVFTHADSVGIFLHFLLAETESGNENYHDNGTLGNERKLFYRELIARFGHHLGIDWDIGEENDYGTTKRKQFAAHIKALDAYDHPVTTHTHTNQMQSFYGPLLGNDDFDMTAFQITESGLNNGLTVEDWRTSSAAAGVPWVISIDEPQKIENDPSDESNGYPHGRKEFLWPIYLSGGGGFEWYVQQDGGGHSLDQQINNFRWMETALRWTGYARDFIHTLPFWEMEPARQLGSSTAGGTTLVLAKPGDTYALYNANGGTLSLNLSGDPGAFEVTWFNPRNGTWHTGSTVSGGSTVSLGSAPFSSDAAVRVARTGQLGPVASFTATPVSGHAPLAVSFDGWSSFDDGQIVSYAWVFGDGGSGSGMTINHTFAVPGTYSTVLTVTDDQGETGQSSRTIVVTDPGSSEETTVSLAPIEDAYIEGSSGVNNSFLKVQSGLRTSYLKFAVSGVSGAVQSARLRLRQSSDPSNGISMSIYRSNTNSWSESSLTSENAPGTDTLVASFNGSVSSGTTLSLDLVPGSVLGNGTYSFVVSSSGGNDAWFGSSESGLSPTLEVTYGGTGAPPAGCAAPQQKPKLVVLADAGRSRFRVLGEGTLPADPTVDPMTHGASFRIETASGTPLFEVEASAGAWDPEAAAGWRLNRAGTVWRYLEKDANGPTQVRFTIRNTAGGLKFVVLVKHLPISLPHPTSVVTKVFPNTGGACGGIAFRGPEGDRPRCVLNGKGIRLTCR